MDSAEKPAAAELGRIASRQRNDPGANAGLAGGQRHSRLNHRFPAPILSAVYKPVNKSLFKLNVVNIQKSVLLTQ